MGVFLYDAGVAVTPTLSEFNAGDQFPDEFFEAGDGYLGTVALSPCGTERISVAGAGDRYLRQRLLEGRNGQRRWNNLGRGFDTLARLLSLHPSVKAWRSDLFEALPNGPRDLPMPWAEAFEPYRVKCQEARLGALRASFGDRLPAWIGKVVDPAAERSEGYSGVIAANETWRLALNSCGSGWLIQRRFKSGWRVVFTAWTFADVIASLRGTGLGKRVAGEGMRDLYSGPYIDEFGRQTMPPV